jgi:hypothetical protein
MNISGFTGSEYTAGVSNIYLNDGSGNFSLSSHNTIKALRSSDIALGVSTQMAILTSSWRGTAMEAGEYSAIPGYT